METISSSKRQVKPQKGLPLLSPTGAKPRFSRSEAITPQVHTRAIQKPLKCIRLPSESLKVTLVPQNFEITKIMNHLVRIEIKVGGNTKYTTKIQEVVHICRNIL
jgi:hypothetical protein